jgi:hypothetical protein
MGMLSRAAWGRAEFIGLGSKPDKLACPWLRKSFDLPMVERHEPAAALLYVASVGYHELTVNGQPASTGVLLPSVSYLPKRVLYRTYNVSALLRPGKNAIGLWTSAGWASYGDLEPRLGENNSEPGRALAGMAPLVLARLEVEMLPRSSAAAGKQFVVVSDGSWKVHASTTTHLGPWGTGPSGGGGWGTGFGGDALDASKVIDGWDTAELDEDDWEAVVSHPVPPTLLISADMVEPTVRHSSVPAKTVGVFESVAAAIDAACAAAGPGIAGGCPPGQEPCKDHPVRCCQSVNGTCPPRPCSSHPDRTFCPTNKTSGQCDQPMPHPPCPPGNCPAGPPPPPHHPPGPAPPGGPIHVTMEEVFTGWFEVRNMTGKPHSTVTFQVSTFPGVPIEFSMQDTYTFDDSGRGSFRMRFAYHEIHYITITGLLHPPLLTDIVGTRLTSLGAQTGDFRASSELITSIYTTTINNYRGLTTGGMTVDCPHRERRGYGGDAHTSYQFALANFPVGNFFNKWLRDFADASGAATLNTTTDMPPCSMPGACWVPNTAPTVSGGGGPAWSGYVVTNPWQTYNTFGDEDILEDMYPTMVSLLAFYAAATHAEDGLVHCYGTSCVTQHMNFLGDWITPHGSEGNSTQLDTILFNNCYISYISRLVGRISTILGYDDKASKYTAMADRLAAAVTRRFANISSGVYLDTLQTHSLMPLATGVVPTDLRNKTMSTLERQILVTNKGHLDTGLTGTYFLFKYLMESGRNDLLFTMANQTTFPSYGWFLAQGYTTWPENWNTTVVHSHHGNHGPIPNSVMHGCYNGIGLWFVEGIAGIRVHASEEPALTIRAGIDAGDLEWASGHRAALHGMAHSSWLVGGGGFTHNITVPGNGLARVLIPCGVDGVNSVTESGTALKKAIGVQVRGTGSECEAVVNGVRHVELAVRSGRYRFASTWRRAT